MTDAEKLLIQEGILRDNDYVVKGRDYTIKPEFPGKYMLIDLIDSPEEGYCIVGDDRNALIAEAYSHMGYDEVEDY